MTKTLSVIDPRAGQPVTITVPADRPTRLGSNILLTLGTMTLAQIMAPTAAQAQCNSNSNPAPPSPVVANFSNQSFGNTQPYNVASFGLVGCVGPDGSRGESGQPGSPGQPGAQISSTNSALTIIGVSAPIVSRGGAGGAGGESGYVSNNGIKGGDGGAGGAGGNLTVRFDGTFAPDQRTGLALFGVLATSVGGTGGAGGPNDVNGTYERIAGNGGAGGTGGSVGLVASGAIAAITGGVQARSAGGAGGAGADSFQNFIDTTQGGAGGNGGAGGLAFLQWLSDTVQTNQFGLLATAGGGVGGNGGHAGNGYGPSGGDGGAGGNGGTAGVLLSGGAITVNQIPFSDTIVGIQVDANGGDGGAGGTAGTGVSTGGGSGGNGGSGGSANATILGTVTLNGSVVTQGTQHAVLVQANGGSGGRGGDTGGGVTGQAGGGGFAGAGGSATLTLGNATTPGILKTSGNFGHGAVVQSVGGSGGNGGQANFVFGSGGTGGAGEAGGDGGPVTVNAPKSSAIASSVIATGPNSIALLAQSVGGGGGVGGDATGLAIGAGVAIGGNGGHGGNGGPVTLNLSEAVFASTNTLCIINTTSCLGGAGVLAQSIGGSGGAGGSATLKGAGLVVLTIGGDGGGGGVGGGVSVVNSGLITSHGDHAAGLQAQSIGGGGGKGGAAVSFNDGSVIPTVSVAVGGRGGGGGPGGNVSVSNAGQVTTYGADAYGVNIHSIGGGGGSGGIAAARAVNISGDPEIPSISLSASIGGNGGAGNTAGTVGLDNSGLITTAGDGAVGVMAQSIGGGGGNGGDSTAASYAAGPQDGVAIALTVAVGGTGGSGGTGGAVIITNEGLVATLGQDAFGVFAQSVGGGGGMGGAGDASASAQNAKSGFGTSLGIGGKGGTGGHAGVVSLTNSGAITTRGDGADAVFAQSVGGGGGVAGGGVATANGGKLSIAVGVGGKGGAGGSGNTATVTNSGSIVTRGTDSIGISVQSVGGGGGKGGKGGATAGGTNPVSNVKSLFDILTGGLNGNQKVTDLGDGILQIGQIGQEFQATYDELNKIFSEAQGGAQPQAGQSNIGNSVNLNVGVSVGGKGGTAGNGGAAIATNTGSITTYGAQSDAIYAQSVGGGGGSGGAATSTDKALNDTPVQASLAVGGEGSGGGTGGPVTVTNGIGGTIRTEGVAAFGIFAQSVGGGGGEGSLAGTVNGSLQSLGVGIGGNGGGGGDGGVVTVTTGDGGSTITTTGKHGIAIFAQSVGGGGGLVRTMTTDQTFDPSKIISNPQGRLADVHGFSLNLGGQNGFAGAGGGVNVFASGPITTSGLDAHAILAQSIGAGGGMAVGGQFASLRDHAGSGSGDGGNVKVELQPGARISTSGAGAYGILAQSIGGGGGAAGDFSHAPDHYGTNTEAFVTGGSGNGGAVSITVDRASVHTTGSYAPAIFAQSIGGGGGLINWVRSPGDDIQARGTAGGAGTGGPVNINLVKSTVVADGVGSAGILAQSEGTAKSPIVISIDPQSTVQGGLTDPKFKSMAPSERDVAAIRLLGGTANKITNDGTIYGDATPSRGTAILADSSESNNTINKGTIHGNIIFEGGAGNVVTNLVGGVISAPTTLNLSGGVLQNAGTLHVGGIGTIGTTTLTGDLVQSSPGSVHIDIDPARGRTDLLQISGRAALDGAIVVNPISVHKGTSGPVITAAGGLTVAPLLQGTTGLVFTHSLLVLGNSLSIATDADFKSNDPSKSTNQRGAAGYLQRIWDSGAPGFDQGFLGLSRLSSVHAYTLALDSLSGEVHASTAGVLVDESRYMRGAVLGRLRQASYGGYTGMAPLAFGGPLAFADGEELSALAYAKSPVVKAPLVAPSPTPDVVFWTQGFGAWGRFEGDGNAASVRRDLAGFITGVDTRVGTNGRAGIAAGYIGSRNNLDGRGSANVETGQVAAYGGWSFGAVNLRAGGAYAFHAIDTDRTIAFPGFFDHATARYGGGTGQIFGELGYGFSFGNVAVEPFAGGAWVRLDTDGAAERATTAGLNIAANSFEVGYSTLGIRAASLIPIGDGMVLIPRASAAWQHAFNSVTPAAELAFQLAPAAPFVIAGVPIARDSLLAEVGVDLAIGRNATLGLSYLGQIASNVQDHAAKGKFSWRF